MIISMFFQHTDLIILLPFLKIQSPNLAEQPTAFTFWTESSM